MKWNIKLDMENMTDGLIAIHSLLTRICFNFLAHRTDQSLQKSEILSTRQNKNVTFEIQQNKI